MFLKFFRVEGFQRRPGVKEKFQTTLILVLEVIVQSLNCFFEIFSSLQVPFGFGDSPLKKKNKKNDFSVQGNCANTPTHI